MTWVAEARQQGAPPAPARCAEGRRSVFGEAAAGVKHAHTLLRGVWCVQSVARRYGCPLVLPHACVLTVARQCLPSAGGSSAGLHIFFSAAWVGRPGWRTRTSNSAEECLAGRPHRPCSLGAMAGTAVTHATCNGSSHSPPSSGGSLHPWETKGWPVPLPQHTPNQATLTLSVHETTFIVATLRSCGFGCLGSTWRRTAKLADCDCLSLFPGTEGPLWCRREPWVSPS